MWLKCLIIGCISWQLLFSLPGHVKSFAFNVNLVQCEVSERGILRVVSVASQFRAQTLAQGNSIQGVSLYDRHGVNLFLRVFSRLLFLGVFFYSQATVVSQLVCLGSLHITAKPFDFSQFYSPYADLPDFQLAISSNAF